MTILLYHQATQIDKQTDIANTLMARYYKGFGNQAMNGVIEYGFGNDSKLEKSIKPIGKGFRKE